MISQLKKKTGRASSITIDNAITAFLTKVKIGPEFVCTSCHRMMYKKCFVPFNSTKYKKATSDVLNKVFCDEFKHVCSDSKQWVYKTCDSALTRGNMPLQAKANGLQLQPIPPELSSLNALELRLILLRIPFMKMVALPSGKQCCNHGPAVNVPSRLKRKLQYKGHYMYNYVRPDKVMNALIWLKANNPLYANISINNDWINDSLANDTELFTSLTQQPNEIVNKEEVIEIVNTEELNEIGNTKELNEIVKTEEPNEKEELNEIVTTEQPYEIVTTEEPELIIEVSTSDQLDIITNAYNMLSSIAQRNGYNIHNVAADGNCLFAAIAYQLPFIGIHNIDIHALRNNVVSHLENNPYVNDVHYCNFLSAPVSTSNSYNADTEASTAEDEYIYI